MAYYSVHSTNPREKNRSTGRPTQIERRRATRHHFVSAVEVINVESRKQLVSLTRNLSLCGCFVTVKVPSPKGTRVSLKISNSKANFSAVGDVTHNLLDTLQLFICLEFKHSRGPVWQREGLAPGIFPSL